MMELSKNEENLIKAYRNGAKISIYFFNCKSYTDAIYKLKTSGYKELIGRKLFGNTLSVKTPVDLDGRIEAAAFYPEEKGQ